MQDRILVSIAVSRPEGGLAPLPGAVCAARDVAEWAHEHGYATVRIDDDAYPEVTVDLLREKMTAAIRAVTDEVELKRLVIFFAGHGAALAPGDQYWLLTHWKRRPSEAVKVSSLQRALEYYGPRQVAVIGDACQEFEAQFINVVGSPILDSPDETPRPFELDQFLAAEVGKQAFMIPGSDGRDAFCLFTQVLLTGLTGDASGESVEEIQGNRCVTSQSLARHLVRHVPREAGRHNVHMRPRPRPGFYTDRVYLTLTSSGPDGPGQATASGEVKGLRARRLVASTERPAIARHADRDFTFSSSARPAWLRTPEVMQHALARARRLYRRYTASTGAAAAATPGPTPAPSSQMQPDADAPVQDATPPVPGAYEAQREAQRDAYVDILTRAAVHPLELGDCGLCVGGADVVHLTAASATVRAADPGCFAIECGTSSDSPAWSDVLVTVEGGRIYSACVLRGFVATLHVVDAESVALLHHPLDGPADEDAWAIAMLADAHAGLLTEDRIDAAARKLHSAAHPVITLACLAAQRYDTVRDVDSLRALAACFASRGWPVPLDIVLYGGGRIAEADGRLVADIPATAARSSPDPRAFTADTSPAFAAHPIAGRLPWMRHAWGAVSTARCAPSAVHWRAQALRAMDHLAPGAFSNFTPDGRDTLLRLVQAAPEPRAGFAATAPQPPGGKA